jgi:hypothetical protein
MTLQKSHFRTFIRTVSILVAILVPLTLALRGSWLLGTNVVAEQAVDLERIKNQEIRGEVRFLSDEIFDEIELVKLRATSAVQNDSLPTDSKGLVAVADLARGRYVPASAEQELSKSFKAISESDIRNSGVSLFSVTLKTGKGTEALGVAFQMGGRRIIAVVDPVEAFKGLGDFSNGKEGEHLHGFLINEQGKVLVHSEKALSGASFADRPIFQEAIAPVFNGQRVGGVGVFPNSRASYTKLRSLPYVVVAERAIRPGNQPTMANRLGTILKNFKAQIFSNLFVLVLSVLGSLILVFGAFDEALSLEVRKPRKSSDAVLEQFQAERLKRAEEQFSEKTKEIEFLRSQTLVLGDEAGVQPRKPS